MCPECGVPDVNVLQHEIQGSHTNMETTQFNQANQEEGNEVFQNVLEINMICILHQMWVMIINIITEFLISTFPPCPQSEGQARVSSPMIISRFSL